MAGRCTQRLGVCMSTRKVKVGEDPGNVPCPRLSAAPWSTRPPTCGLNDQLHPPPRSWQPPNPRPQSLLRQRQVPADRPGRARSQLGAGVHPPHARAQSPAQPGLRLPHAGLHPALRLLLAQLHRPPRPDPPAAHRGARALPDLRDPLQPRLPLAARQELAITPTSPTYLCWFLIALFVWRLTTPIWNAVRHPVAIAVVVSLAAGTTVIGEDLALPRVLMFLPWFVLGLRLRPEHFARLRTRTARRVAVPVFARRPRARLPAVTRPRATTGCRWTWETARCTSRPSGTCCSGWPCSR